MSTPAESSASPKPKAPQPLEAEARFEHTNNFVPLLEQLGITVLFSTYQAGKLGVLAAHKGKLELTFHHFDRAMGIAVKPGRIAIGAHGQVWFLRSYPDVAPKLEPLGEHDAAFLVRTSQFTGDIHIHDLAWAGEQLWIVNTMFSCLCTLHEHYSFTPQWKPPFISTLASEDRCHLNGLALVDGAPRYVTVLGQTDTQGGWRPAKASGGCVLEVPSGRVVAGGFAMPHSPRYYNGKLFLLHSGHGQVGTVDVTNGTFQSLGEVPGYTRGLALHGPLAFVGMSKIRETSTFGGMPIEAKRSELKCGIAIVNLQTQQMIAYIEFHTGVSEIYDVQVLPGIRFPIFSGPHPVRDGVKPVWTVPTQQEAKNRDSRTIDG